MRTALLPGTNYGMGMRSLAARFEGRGRLEAATKGWGEAGPGRAGVRGRRPGLRTRPGADTERLFRAVI